VSALSELFDETRLLVPVKPHARRDGEAPLTGHRLTVIPLTPRHGQGIASKLSFVPWLIRNRGVILQEVRSADAIHTPIPGDVGTIGMLLARLKRKPLFVRHCGNWARPVTVAERFWRWFMEREASNGNVMLATGGAPEPPSSRNARVKWIFSSSLTKAELASSALPRSFDADRVRLIIVARQEAAKGSGAVIRSLPQLSARFPSIHFEVVGDGSAIDEFKRLAAECGVANRVTFAGKLSHDRVLERLRASTLFVFPTSSSEGFPKAVLEALATGLPVIATRVSVLPSLLQNDCGILLDDDSPDAIARAVEEALSNPGRYEARSRRAIETASGYSLEDWRDAIGRHLEEAWGPLRSASR
jgi:glycosyltransferase involved in cell wall biosynthesis